jgi:tetratricopeptide (TPR) repeat protein
MICPSCRAEVKDSPFCPQCGHRLQEIPLGKPGRRTRRRLFLRRWVLPLFLLLVVIAFSVLALALRGFQDGIQDRDRANHRQAEILYNRGEVYLELGQWQLAEAHFEEALRLAPDYAEAQDKLQIAQAKQTVTPSPTPPPPTPTPVPPTPTPEVIVVPLVDVLYAEGKAHYEAEEWELAIAKLEQLRIEDINYESEQVTEMLFESHKAYGQILDQEDQIEAAILQYDRALDLRPRNPEVSELRRQADLYQSALNDWGIDWESVINFLIALYHVSPEYKDTTERLYGACITYGEEMVKQERYCTASEYYEQAVKIRDDDATVVKREEDTSHLCSARPEPLETPAVSITQSMWSEVHIGTLIATCYDPHEDQYDICAQNAEDNSLQTWITQTEQPAITLDGTKLAYRSSAAERPGLYAMDMISGTVVTVTVDANAHYPTWSPDGTYLAYTQYDEEQEDWFIYVAEASSGTPPVRIRKGEWPSWGPDSLLAFTTCGQENDCGIYVYDPNTGGLRRVTSSKQDRAAAWSPSGDEIAYTSDIGLSFNLYVVNIKGENTWGRQITKNLFADVMPVWSPDGQRIAFITNHNDDWSVYSIHPYPGEGQAEQIISLGAESADWQRFRLAWTAPIVAPPRGEE